jgi:DNA helicase-2/ATP-dependent DNA helicase PcrA
VRNEGQAVAVALEERAVAYRLLGAAAFFQRAEVRDVLAWLRLLVDPGDAGAVARALSRPPVELRSIDLARCVQIARRRKLDMVAALAAATESPQLPPEARDRILAFLKLHRSASAALDTTRPDLFVHRLVDRLGLRRQQLFAAQADVVERLRALARLGELAADHVRRAPQATAREFARYVAAVADAGLNDDEASADAAGAGAGSRPGFVTVASMSGCTGLELDHVFVLGLQAARMPGARLSLVEPVPDELAGGAGAASSRERHEHDMRRLLHAAMTRAREGLVLAYAASGDRDDRRPPSPFAEEARAALGAQWEDREEELFGPDEALHATFTALRDELLSSVSTIGSRLGEMRLDTDLDVTHGVTRYLELVKLAALIERPAGQPVADALRDVNARLLQAASAHQREVFLTSTLDELILGAERDERARAAALAAREEPSLEAFLPRRGDGLTLSASDIETYRSCPLRYKFARVFRIPSEPTLNQRFGIVVHQVLERFHAAGSRSADELLGLLEGAWRRGGLGDTEQERQLHGKATAALRRYHERFVGERAEPVWLEKAFQFKLGPHVLRGRVDRVDRLPDGGYELIDYKTGRPKSVAQLREDVQLSLYAVGAREAWQVDAPRQAYLYVLDDEKVSVPAEEIDPSWIRDTVFEVADGILGQGFEPTPSFAACSMCDYRIACPAAER